MPKVLIVFHSQSGTTAGLMAAVREGAREEGAEVRMVAALEASLNDLIWCDGVIFGSPENLGYLSGGLKNFFDRTFYPAQPLQLNLPYAVVISAGNDGTNAVKQLQRIASGYPMRCVSEPLVVVGELRASQVERCRELGQGFCAGLTMGIF